MLMLDVEWDGAREMLVVTNVGLGRAGAAQILARADMMRRPRPQGQTLTFRESNLRCRPRSDCKNGIKSRELWAHLLKLSGVYKLCNARGKDIKRQSPRIL